MKLFKLKANFNSKNNVSGLNLLFLYLTNSLINAVVFLIYSSL
jgi:hypothetical protein